MHDAEALWQEALRWIEQMQQGQGREAFPRRTVCGPSNDTMS